MNEYNGCKIDLPQIPYFLFSEVFAIDGKSQDGTLELLKKKNIVVYSQLKSGYNQAYLEAFERFTGDAIIFFHPKGTINPNNLFEMVELLNQNKDLVIASRMLRDSINEEDNFFIRPRKMFGKLLSTVAWLKWGNKAQAKITDPLHGFRGLSKKFIKNFLLTNNNVTADLEMIKHTYLNHLSIAEFAVQESKRIHGETHFPAFSTGKRLIKFLLFER